jgi:hypothetical protein
MEFVHGWKKESLSRYINTLRAINYAFQEKVEIMSFCSTGTNIKSKSQCCQAPTNQCLRNCKLDSSIPCKMETFTVANAVQYIPNLHLYFVFYMKSLFIKKRKNGGHNVSYRAAFRLKFFSDYLIYLRYVRKFLLKINMWGSKKNCIFTWISNMYAIN